MSLKTANNRKSGFSLVQVSVLLAVGGLILAASLPGGDKSDDASKIALTKERLRKIDEATKAFMAANQRRPCPSDGTVAVTDASFGVEGGSGVAGSCDISSNFGPNCVVITGLDSSCISAGTLPVRTLGLPDEYAFDGWGRRFMYMVSGRATNTAECRYQQSRGMSGSIRIIPAYNTATPNDYVMALVVSYGKDGHGAFPAGAVAINRRINTYTSNADTLHNAFVDSTFTYTNPTTFSGTVVKRDAYAGFDDIVWYDESTKNTCCIGPRCNQGFRIDTNATVLSTTNGVQVATGDINGDGIKDIVYANLSAASGQVKVIYGSQSGWPVVPNAADGTTSSIIRISKAGADANFGYTIGVGDVTNDGRDDIVINAQGKAYLVFDLVTTGALDIATLTSTNKATAFTTYGVGAPGPVAFGDVNGDGYKDILMAPDIVGAYTLGVVWGRANASWPASIDMLASAANSIVLFNSSLRPWVAFQSGLASGNINGDFNGANPYDDIVAGGALDGTGTVTLILGRSSANWAAALTMGNLVAIDAMEVSGTGGAKFITTLASEAYLGQSVSVTDFDGDGYPDIVIASNRSIYGVRGKSANFNAGAAGNRVSAGAASWRIDTITNRPAAASLALFYSILRMGDVNGDSLPDIVLGNLNSYMNNAANAGMTYVMFQPTKALGWAQDGFTANFVMTMFSADNGGYSNFDGTKGFVIEGAAADYAGIPALLDFNKDRKLDILIGAPGYGAGDAGAVYTIYGRTDTPWMSRYSPGSATPANWPKIDLTDLSQ